MDFLNGAVDCGHFPAPRHDGEHLDPAPSKTLDNLGRAISGTIIGNQDLQMIWRIMQLQ